MAAAVGHRYALARQDGESDGVAEFAGSFAATPELGQKTSDRVEHRDLPRQSIQDDDIPTGVELGVRNPSEDLFVVIAGLTQFPGW